MTSDRFAPGRVRSRLEGLTREPRERWHDRGDLVGDHLEEAAVLIPISERDGSFHTVLTHRSEELENHSGEVSFPGGRPESVDNSLAETALREAYEEIGLDPSDVNLFGAITEMPTVTGYRIVAYVAEFPDPYELIPNPDEIELIFDAPLERLADEEIHRIERREFAGDVYPVHFFEYEGHTIWGATGFLLHTFLDYLGLVDRDVRSES